VYIKNDMGLHPCNDHWRLTSDLPLASCMFVCTDTVASADTASLGSDQYSPSGRFVYRCVWVHKSQSSHCSVHPSYLYWKQLAPWHTLAAFPTRTHSEKTHSHYSLLFYTKPISSSGNLSQLACIFLRSFQDAVLHSISQKWGEKSH